MATFTDQYLAYYTPLVQDFVRKANELSHPDIKGMPQPFLPLFGPGYETSALQLVIVGQDTLGWGDLRRFLDAEKVSPGSELKGGLEYFGKRPFRDWGATRQRFFGFTMMLLAALHGQKDWGLMKQDKMGEILDSFAWANANAVELHRSSAAAKCVPRDYWESIRSAAEPLNRFRHLAATLKPRVVLIMYRGLNRATYFEPYKPRVVAQDGRLTHYQIPEINVDIIHLPHPGSMNRFEGPDHFCAKLKELFIQRGFTMQFPGFLNGQRESSDVIEYLRVHAPPRTSDCDKYAYVSWIAEELTKRGSFMSVPTLANLINGRGEKTNYGTEYSGGRGSYRLVQGAYHRLKKQGAKESDAKAHNVATAFRRPNFEYAYSTD